MTKTIFHSVFVAMVALFVLMAPTRRASAQFVINSPKVEKGEVEVETHGSYSSGFPRSEADDEDAEAPVRHGDEVEVGYGITDFWKLELGFGFQKPQGEGWEGTEIEIENTFQLTEVKRWDMTIGFLASVAFGVGGADEPNAFEFGPLIQFGKEDDRSLILNAIFEKTFGENREDGLGFEYAAQLKAFKLRDNIMLGAEAFGEIENIDDVPSFDETELRIGPAIYFKFGGDNDDDKGKHKGLKDKDDDDDKGMKDADEGPEVEVGVGLLFGATDATPDVTLKWDLEVSF